MNNEKFKRYTIDTIILLKDFVRKAKLEAANQKEGSNGYAEGVIMGYYSIITLLKHEAFAFCIDQKENRPEVIRSVPVNQHSIRGAPNQLVCRCRVCLPYHTLSRPADESGHKIPSPQTERCSSSCTVCSPHRK